MLTSTHTKPHYHTLSVLLPQLEFTQTIDEVAFILGHELAHFVLGHVSTANQIEVSLKVTEIVLLALDPTAGLVTFAVVVWLDFVRRCIARAFSRKHERQADALGLQLVQRAGKQYDLLAGARFMERLSRVEESSKAISLLETHPPSLERAQSLRHEVRVLLETSTPTNGTTAVPNGKTKQQSS